MYTEYWLSITSWAFYIAGDFLDSFCQEEGFQTLHGMPLHSSPTGCIIICHTTCHPRPSLPHCRLEWLLHPKPYHGATEKPQGRPSKWLAPSTTHAKLCQVSVECTSFALQFAFRIELKSGAPEPYTSYWPSAISRQFACIYALYSPCMLCVFLHVVCASCYAVGTCIDT